MRCFFYFIKSQIWKQHKGEITNRAIAEQLDVSEKTIGGWKSKDNWNAESDDEYANDLEELADGLTR